MATGSTNLTPEQIDFLSEMFPYKPTFWEKIIDFFNL